jgi:hypothetical protein
VAVAKKQKSAIKTGKLEVVSPCACCGGTKTDNYYKSFNPLHKELGRFPVCKTCMEVEYQRYLLKYADGKLAIYFTCRTFDIYFSVSCYEGAIKNSITTGWTILQSYFKQINSFRDKNAYGNCFEESTEFLDRHIISDNSDVVSNIKDKPEKKEVQLTEEDKQNEEDVKKLLGYDPFENENKSDRKFLYNKLIDYLDQATLDDNFKVPIVIEIVKSFNQIEKMNQAVNSFDVSKMSENVTDVKNLMSAKTTTLNAILSMAKDNGISVNHNNSKSKGENTLNGVVKKLNEMGLSTAELNLFDIETCESMKQIADFSNKSIREQLLFDENDYTDMIAQQSDLIKKMDNELIKLKEDNRLLIIKNKGLEQELIKN